MLLQVQEGEELQDKHCGPGEGKDYKRNFVMCLAMENMINVPEQTSSVF